MRSWFQRFMSGRYGFDQLGGFLCIVSFILVIVGAWVLSLIHIYGDHILHNVSIPVYSTSVNLL